MKLDIPSTGIKPPVSEPHEQSQTLGATRRNFHSSQCRRCRRGAQTEKTKENRGGSTSL